MGVIYNFVAMLVNYFVIFTFGTIVGSFLNVCIYRLPRGKSIAWPPSYCPHCNEKIPWFENLPVISFFMLRGKCGRCVENISIRYPIVEILTGFLFVLVPVILGFGIWDLEFYFSIAFISFLILNFFSDLETELIPDIPVYIIIFLGLFYNFAAGDIKDSLVGIAGGFFFFTAIGFLGKLYYKKDVLGDGDTKLAVAFGAFMGWQGLILSLLIGYLIGGATSILLISFKKKGLKDYIPFAPSLTSGALIALFFGSKIIKFYLANFF